MRRGERLLLAAVGVMTGLAAVGRYVGGVPHVIAFVLAALALAGDAWAVSFSTEQIGMQFGPGITGLLQSTVGNLPEFFVVIFALQDHDTIVAQTAILGSIFSNALLVLGLVLCAGSLRSPGRVMRFSPGLPKDTATLLFSAGFMVMLVGIAGAAHDPARHHTATISVVGSAAMLVVYAIWLRQYLLGDSAPELDEQAERPRIGMRTALMLLAFAGVSAAFVSDWFVAALEPTIHMLHISQAFAGIVIVAIAGNAVEHTAGIYLAFRGRHDLAISVVKNSVAQIAAFLYPLLVLVSLLTATHLTFALAPIWIGALIATAVLIWQITGDGEATPFEGAALVAFYVVLATVAAFES